MNQMEFDDVNFVLQQLVLTAQQHPYMSQERQLAITRLINSIVQSGRLFHPQKNQFSVEVYEDIYNEALQELLLYICQNIDKYDPKRGSVMTWVNFLLDRRFFKEAVSKFFGQENVIRITNDHLENLVPDEEPQDITEILIECIKSDPEGIFKQEHIKLHPQANFQALAQRRMSGKSWKEIATEYHLKVPTVSSFYYRCLSQFASKIKTYCQDYVV